MMNRRHFIRSTAALTAGLTLPAWAKSASANDTVNVALLGCRRGWSDLQKFLTHKEIRCVALCDVKEDVLAAREADVARHGAKPDLYGDYRRVLDRKDVDMVIIGTPDHWHCLQFVDACKAGKDIYVEKPIANSIAECDAMVAAATKYSHVITTVGQQQRSDTLWHEMIKYLKTGKLGRIARVHVWANFNYGAYPPPVPDSPVPAGLDFDMWLGPAPLIPFNERRFRWRMNWDYGGGLMTDWGVHLLDMGLWGMDIKTMPVKTFATGGKYFRPTGAHQTFDTLSVTYQFKDFILTWENNGGVETGPYGKNYGVLFRGENGTLVANRESWEVYPEGEKIPVVKVESDKRDLQNHVDNFLACVKTRRKETACTIENGCLCAKYAHLGNIGARMGGVALAYDDQAKKFDVPEADKYLKPAYRSPWIFPEFS